MFALFIDVVLFWQSSSDDTLVLRRDWNSLLLVPVGSFVAERVDTRVVTTRRATIGTTPLNAKSLVSMQKTLNVVGKVKSITIISTD
jgi:hypothetical protein